ncbi:hypothetical protein DVK02_04560 [Halobellus sp. Atlit-31R]|nr:hypothetical protein DVK02_04560 [Halobellus sp. Atlit-31R]
MLPLQLVDSFLLNYNVGQALLLVFVVATVGVLPLKSQRLVALNAIVFGLIFALTPQSLVPIHYLFLGLALLVVGPLLYATSSN